MIWLVNMLPRPYVSCLIWNKQFYVLKVYIILFYSSLDLPCPKILRTWRSDAKVCEYSEFLFACSHANFKVDRKYSVMVTSLVKLRWWWLRIFNTRPSIILCLGYAIIIIKLWLCVTIVPTGFLTRIMLVILCPWRQCILVALVLFSVIENLATLRR